MLTRKKLLKMASLTLGFLVLPFGIVKPLFAGKISFSRAKSAARGGVRLKAPSIAESGGSVPVAVEGSMPASSVKAIYIFVDKNPTPYAMHMELGSNSKVYLKTNVKMGKSSTVRGVIEMKNGSLKQATKNVKVTVGGCG